MKYSDHESNMYPRCVLPYDGELSEGHGGELQAVRERDDLHPSRTLGGVVLQTLGHLFFLYKRRSTGGESFSTGSST